MLLGIISDTHGSLSSHAYRALEGCDAIVHAGDIGSSRVLWQLETIAPVTAVLGNCDYSDYGPTVKNLAAPLFDGVRFKVVHRPQDIGFIERDVKVVVHGHTHRRRNEVVCGVLYLNPGSASDPRGGEEASVALVALERGAVKRVDFIDF